MAIRIQKHTYQTDEHIKCVTSVATDNMLVRCLVIQGEAFVTPLGKSAKLCMYTI